MEGAERGGVAVAVVVETRGLATREAMAVGWVAARVARLGGEVEVRAVAEDSATEAVAAVWARVEA